MHLCKTLLKIKPIASAPSFPQHVQTTVEVVRKPLDTASANVQARLFKSVPVQTAMTETLRNIRATLAIPEIKKGTKKRSGAKDLANSTSIKATSNATPPKERKYPKRLMMSGRGYPIQNLHDGVTVSEIATTLTRTMICMPRDWLRPRMRTLIQSTPVDSS